MPCPAEYNFYFTHDALVTDLAAVNFDLARVRRDLDYIVRHSDENNVIPHAYYWKDGKYVTEFASSDNWNNFWFIQVAAKYLRHSGDSDFLTQLYPYLTVSVERSLLTLEKDNLMWSYRPDWWDIGHNYGPRSYMTILAIKSLRDYAYISTVLGKNPEKVVELMALADKMQTALVAKLWNDDMGYLINYNEDGSLDSHYYIGSLLAVPYGLLDTEKQNRLVQTATAKLLDEKVGIYNVYPMDFHLLGDFYKFVGNEVGDKYYYTNGGVWPQGNAWYA
jgi:glycogen debranching enzyme